jgi:SAM-dependent methyltransferase
MKVLWRVERMLMLNFIRYFSDERRKLTKLLRDLDRNTPVLDVGCGYGRNLLLMRQMGFTNLAGVEINPVLAAQVRAQGFECFSPDDMEGNSGRYGMLLMSHIIEHFEYVSLKSFIESYLRCLRSEGFLVIATPLFHDAFYNDFDHVKPYLPLGINMVFGAEAAQVQFQSSHVLRLEAIDFFKDQLRVRFHPAIYKLGSQAWPIQLNRLLKLLFVLSGGLIGRKVGWIGCYRQLGSRSDGSDR